MGSHSLLSLTLLSVVYLAACANGAQIQWNYSPLPNWLKQTMDSIIKECSCYLSDKEYRYALVFSNSLYIVQHADNQMFTCEVNTGDLCSRIGKNPRTCVFGGFPNNFYCV